MGLFNVNINSDQINQYQYKEINDGKSLEISKNGKPIGNVAAHRTLIHRGQMDEVKTITGKKFYIKHNDFTAAITPSSVNIQNKDQTTAAHNNNNNNNNNNQSDQIKDQMVNNSEETAAQPKAIENQPFKCKSTILIRAGYNLSYLRLPALKDHQQWVFFSPIDRKAYSNWIDCLGDRSKLLPVPLEHSGETLRILSSAELAEMHPIYADPNSRYSKKYEEMLGHFEDIKLALERYT